MPEYYVLMFKSVTGAMQAEKILKKSAIPFKIIPLPKTISTDCGICIRFEAEQLESIKLALASKVEYSDIRKI